MLALWALQSQLETKAFRALRAGSYGDAASALVEAVKGNPLLSVMLIAAVLSVVGLVRGAPLAFEATGWMRTENQVRGVDFLLFVGFFHFAWRRVQGKDG